MNPTVQVRITGNNDKEIRSFISMIMFGIEAAMKLSMTEPKHGPEYRRGGGTHTASAPGEAPAVDMSFLITTIDTRIISDTEAEIIIPAEYAEALEFGTSRMAARPFVEPAIESVLKKFDRGGFLSQGIE
jgi:hypothetical protein